MPRLLLIAALMGLAACDASVENAFKENVVVESYQTVGEPLASVTLFTNAPIGGVFDRTELAVTDASVRVLLLAADGSVEAEYPYAPDPDIVGGYLPVAPAAVVLPLRRYRLEAGAPGRPLVSSETLTPGAFELRSQSSVDAVWGGDEIELVVTRPFYPERQAIFVFTTETQREAISRSVATPFYRAIFDAQDEDEPDRFDPEDVRIGSSPPLNEGGYVINDDGTVAIELVWLAVPFYGPNKVSASAVDDNIYDLLRSQAVQGGGGTLSPGEIPNVLDRVENGVGIFGSLSRVTTDVFVRCEASRNFGNACPADSQ